MSYSLEAVITEGQSVVLPDSQGDFRPVYLSKYARTPEVSLTLRELRAETTPDNKSIVSLKGMFGISGPDGVESSMELKDSEEFSGKGFRISMEGFGYSPRYVLRDLDGRELDSSFVYLGLFPSGSEDYFRLLSPLTYYLTYYPQKEDDAYFQVRVVRNKDVVFNGNVRLGEEFHFENAAMSIAEVREWTRLRVEGNPGRPFVVAGLFVLLLAAIIELRHMILRGRQTRG